MKNFSMTISKRYYSIMVITSSLLCKYTLNFKIGRHQIFSLIGNGVVLVFQSLIEISYSIEFGDFFKVFLLAIFNLFFVSFTDVIEKYLGDTNFYNPYGIIMGEGIFVFIMNSFYSIGKNVFGQINQLYENFNGGKFVLLIFLLFLYILLSAIINIYKIHCNIFLSPIKRAFSNYLSTPFLIIYYFFFEGDFKNKKGAQNVTIFVLSEIILFLYLFLGFVYNEYIILSCFNLEHDTNYGIFRRASSDYLKDEIDNDEEEFIYNGYKIDFKNDENDGNQI